MKKKIVTILFIALVLSLSLSLLTGCFFQNLSIISGKLSEDSLAALQVLSNEESAEGETMPANFTQTNTLFSEVPDYDGVTVHHLNVLVVYKVTETGIYYQRTVTEEGASTIEEGYFEKDGDKYYRYGKDSKGEWVVMSYTKENYENAVSARSSEVDEDTRGNLFNPSYYKSAGKKYKYTGPEAAITTSGQKMVLDVDGLYVVDGGIDIRSKAYPDGLDASQKKQLEATGYKVNVSYRVTAVGTTTITYPRTVNSKTA